MDKPEENMVNAGIVFMFIAWLQSQMSDLIIFHKQPELIEDFVANPERVPSAFHQIRVTYWEKMFGAVKKEFKETFSSLLTDVEKNELEQLYHFRNMLAHAHISVGRDYMLYKPARGAQHEQKLIQDLNLQSVENQSDPMVLKIELWKEDNFLYASQLIEKFERITLKKIADSLNVPPSRIR